MSVMVKIGINGFGRVGRFLLRIAISEYGKGAIGCDLPAVTMVNDPNLSPDCMGYLLRKDSLYGTFDKNVTEMDNCIMVEGQRVEAVQEKDVTKIPWHKACQVDYIVDTTGQNTTCQASAQHLQERIQKVIVTGCSDIPVFIMGVNHTCYKPTMKTISVGTPSLNCLASMLRVMHENFVIEKALATAIHPLSNNDKILDDSCPTDCREGRSAIVNFMPVKSVASGRFVARVMPELEGKVESTAIKIPIACVGAVELSVLLKRDVSYSIVKTKLKEAADCYMKGIMKYSADDLVSSDIIGDTHSCVIDAKAGVGLPKNAIKLYGWYDAEYAFAHRLYDMVKYVASREVCTN